MKKNTSKARSKEPKQIAPKVPDPRIDPQYYPEQANWWFEAPSDKGSNLPLNQFRLTSPPPEKRFYGGPTIATISVNPAIDPESAERIVRFISYAPDLWRALQQVAPWVLQDCSPNDEFTKIMDLLWQAVDRFPFCHFHPDESEEQIFKENTELLTKKLAETKA